MHATAPAHFDLSDFFDTITGDDQAVAALQQWTETVAGNIADDPNVQAAWTAGEGHDFDNTFVAELYAAILGALQAGTLPSRYLLLADGVVAGMVEAARVAAVAWVAATYAYADAT